MDELTRFDDVANAAADKIARVRKGPRMPFSQLEKLIAGTVREYAYDCVDFHLVMATIARSSFGLVDICPCDIRFKNAEAALKVRGLGTVKDLKDFATIVEGPHRGTIMNFDYAPGLVDVSQAVKETDEKLIAPALLWQFAWGLPKLNLAQIAEVSDESSSIDAFYTFRDQLFTQVLSLMRLLNKNLNILKMSKGDALTQIYRFSKGNRVDEWVTQVLALASDFKSASLKES